MAISSRSTTGSCSRPGHARGKRGRTALAAAALAVASTPAIAAETRWLDGFNQRTRMHSASIEVGGQRTLYAFVEIVMPKGWKTYWRNPGDAGGLPPRFDWSRSENLASAAVHFPAPVRLSDEAGDTIGYKDQVTFPVAIAAKDASRPVRLVLDLTFGICKDICVPSEAAHTLEVAPGEEAASTAAIDALDRVPRTDGDRRSADPVLKTARLDTSGGKPRIVIEADFPAGAEGVDIFVEAPDGLYVPMLTRSGTGAGGERFETELGNALEPKELAGKALSATLVSPGGSTVTTFKLD